MALLDKLTFLGKFNSVVSGLFQPSVSDKIPASRLRTLVEDTKDSFISLVDDLQKKTTAAGTDTYTLTGSLPAYADGFMVVTKFANASTGSSTLNLNGLGAKKIMVTPTTQAGSGDITQNRTYILVYDSALDSAAGAFLIVGSGTINSIDGGSL